MSAATMVSAWPNLGVACLGAILGGCGADGASPRARVGEVHLHAYPSGGVASTLFVDPPTPIERTELDSALPNVYTPAATDGPCRLIVFGSCAPNCAPPDPVDGGPIDVRGLAHALDLSFDVHSGGYLEVKTDDLAAAAGAEVTIGSPGAKKIPGFQGTLRMPRAFHASSTLEQGLDNGLEASWTADDPGASILVDLTIIPRTGTQLLVRCNLDDAAGRLVTPSSLLAQAPPPPRLVSLEIARYRIVDVPVGEGRSVVLHGSDSALFARDEP